MLLRERGNVPGVFDRVLSFVASGRELCLALSSKQMFSVVTNDFDELSSFTELLADFNTMELPELKAELRLGGVGYRCSAGSARAC